MANEMATNEAPEAHVATAAPLSFAAAIREAGLPRLVRDRVTTLQVNVGRLCNLACHHCHVEAGPKATEVMSADVAGRLVELLDVSPSIELLDLTGGAPEMNPSFRFLVEEARRRNSPWQAREPKLPRELSLASL